MATFLLIWSNLSFIFFYFHFTWPTTRTCFLQPWISFILSLFLPLTWCPTLSIFGFNSFRGINRLLLRNYLFRFFFLFFLSFQGQLIVSEYIRHFFFWHLGFLLLNDDFGLFTFFIFHRLLWCTLNWSLLFLILTLLWFFRFGRSMWRFQSWVGFDRGWLFGWDFWWERWCIFLLFEFCRAWNTTYNLLSFIIIKVFIDCLFNL